VHVCTYSDIADFSSSQYNGINNIVSFLTKMMIRKGRFHFIYIAEYREIRMHTYMYPKNIHTHTLVPLY